MDAGGFRLRYVVEGVGIPALVIGSAVYYRRVFSESLRRHLRMTFVDHRGFAPMPERVDRSSFLLDTLLGDIELARAALGLDRFAIVGHSGHAYMALEYAKRHPQRVSHVVMIGIAPDLSAAGTLDAERYWQESVSPERKAVLEANRRALPDRALARLPPGEALVKRCIRDAPRAWFDPHFDAAPLWAGVRVNEVMIRVWSETFPRIDVTAGLGRLDAPVFLALGRYDTLVAPPHSWDRVRPYFRDLTVRVFEKSGHTPPYEEAALFDAELLDWMKRQERLSA